MARKAQPTYKAMIQHVRGSPVVSADETGWRVGGLLHWMHAFVTLQVTVYIIRPGRGFPEASEVLGKDYAGVLNRDGWAPYRRFLKAVHQTCLQHLDRRARELLEAAERGQAKFPHAVRRILRAALDLRERRDQGLISPHGLLVAVGRLEAKTNRVLAGRIAYEPNRVFAKHLRNEREALFTFLKVLGVEASNWMGEHAMRPAVVNRKVWGGNRTQAGAHSQEVLTSFLRTCHQQQRDPGEVLRPLLLSHAPRIADLRLAAGPSPPA
jgi:transposase